MIFTKLGDQVLNLETLAKAEYVAADPDATDTWIELHLLWSNGASTVLYGDDADTAWIYIQNLAGVLGST